MNFVTFDVVDGTLEATGIVSGVSEDGGECTLVLTHDSLRRQTTAAGAAGPESTYCGLMEIPATDFASGDWTAVIEYSSSAYVGRSENQVVTFP